MTELQPKSGHSSARPPPKWLLTFSDMMALLFTLFVMLLSMADFDKRKFESTMAPIRGAFNLYTSESTVRSVLDPDVEIAELPDAYTPVELEAMPEIQHATDRVKQDVVATLKVDLKKELAEKLVSMEETPRGVILRFPSATAFALGGDELSASIHDTLDRVAGVLRNVPGSISVSGHTDDLPIGTDRFRSNWDLSSERAVSVVHYLLGVGIVATRITAAGHADTRPLVLNDSPENRARNRRVEIELVVELAKNGHSANGGNSSERR